MSFDVFTYFSGLRIAKFATLTEAKERADLAAKYRQDCYVTETHMVYTTRKIADDDVEGAREVIAKARAIRTGAA